MDRLASRPGVIVVVLAAALLVRWGFLATHLRSLGDDPDAYRAIAVTLSQTGVFGLAGPTAFRPPLYPWLLSFWVGESGQLSNWAVAIFHGLLGSMTVVLAWDIARRWLSASASCVAAILTAIDPILLWQSTLVMTETLATFLSIVVLWWWCVIFRKPVHWAVSSVVLGTLLSLCYLCRPTFLVWAVLVIPAVWWVRPKGTVPNCRVRRSMSMLVCGLIVAATVGCWTLRNLSAVGHPVWATTHGGYTLYLANNDSFYDYLIEGQRGPPWASRPWDASEFFEAVDRLPKTGREPDDDAIAYEAAKETISRRPTMFWVSCWVRLYRIWQPFPHATAGRSTLAVIAVGLFEVSLYAMCLIALVRHRNRLRRLRWRSFLPLWPAVALAVTLSGVHAVYWSNPRMRSPIIPMLAVVAAASFSLPRWNPNLDPHEQ